MSVLVRQPAAVDLDRIMSGNDAKSLMCVFKLQIQVGMVLSTDKSSEEAYDQNIQECRHYSKPSNGHDSPGVVLQNFCMKLCCAFVPVMRLSKHVVHI